MSFGWVLLDFVGPPHLHVCHEGPPGAYYVQMSERAGLNRIDPHWPDIGAKLNGGIELN